MSSVRCTVSQAVVRYLKNQFTEIDGERVPLFPGVFGIFGHGNVTCFAEALESVKEELPTWRGQNEQSMALAAIAFAKARRRKQIMVATSSIGPGATNFVTAAGLAHANRLPILFISGDVFASRRNDPVLQQVEHFNDPTLTVNDSFKAVTRYWDRITHPEQIISSLPQAVAVMLDPADCGPAFIGLCQDIQEVAFDYPEAFFAPTVHASPRPRPDLNRLAQAAALLAKAERPLIIAGGGVRYSEAEAAVIKFAEERRIPVVETIAGKGCVTHDHPVHVGPLGIVGSTSANALAADADVIVAIGTRLQDFTTGSWTCFSKSAKFISINTARFDAVKHRALALIGDARETVGELDAALGNWHADDAWLRRGREAFAQWNASLAAGRKPTGAPVPTYAQVIGAINDEAGDRDYVISAAGGLPGELVKGWRVKAPGTFDCEFGFSCMGYEIAGGWGAAMADPTRDVFVMVGDGSYMMMNSDIYSSVLAGHKMIVVVCDNGGFGVINRLQNAKGGASFNNLLKDSKVKEAFPVDFVRHAESMGALGRRVDTLDSLRDAVKWAKSNDRTTVISIVTDAFAWTPGDAWWDVGVPEVSAREEVQAARRDQEAGRRKQRIGV
ncbi:3D-(3,5/4)-trihydroxycyclohexane-1,2-dione acylhydrolase (decyclizing) [Burkholderia multivorans]|uniref:Probable malonic semialdehyde oxidative decarboxylase n=1 Tax=Burkholderia multivorans CGD2 TaxID=513052 RepID=B9BHD8_9BURK|nr:3D-(3,5/4)-trihydroxycyclohexane-1,2-dione acylhydrolase (decyclizing) [Burkholderia multivorans]EEE09014.1 probable malonic semialdehyde oxidative decarboxylase [Burkholderia multivorans CGD2]EEE14933.1 probable malonic semialdehyde oxidative decarboxylase [Burkholderia multivorans CGD2M]MBU9141677.1 3D-(3,5/4)-trihydroxycyclohexane-1,2-dione acylhydrolase (decyclizing) [Burkholderia multivorans]MBU9180668.1 3D-(3,5/4)-trihydroxycyclohexane-1,2-dione acylhydrolase (decyclizing) [Burkholderi